MTMSLQADSVSHKELAAQDPSGRLYNEDLAPALTSDRKWDGYQLFSLWMNDAHNAGNYTWAAGLFVGLGMSAFDITLGIFTGSLIIMVGCILSGFMGQATGTPYPVISRITWGVWGANIPAVTSWRRCDRLVRSADLSRLDRAERAAVTGDPGVPRA